MYMGGRGHRGEVGRGVVALPHAEIRPAHLAAGPAEAVVDVAAGAEPGGAWQRIVERRTAIRPVDLCRGRRCQCRAHRRDDPPCQSPPRTTPHTITVTRVLPTVSGNLDPAESG